MSSLSAAVRIGARRAGATVNVHEHEIAAIAERVITEVLSLSEEKLRDLIRNDLLRGKHAGWYEGPLDEHGWRMFLFDTLANFWKYGHDFQPKVRFQVLQGGAL